MVVSAAPISSLTCLAAMMVAVRSPRSLAEEWAEGAEEDVATRRRYILTLFFDGHIFW